MAHNLGAYAVATGGPAKREWLTSFGANQFIDYTSESFVQLLSSNPLSTGKHEGPAVHSLPLLVAGT